MKRMSIRMKITLWYSAALLLVVLFTFFIVVSAGNQIIQKTVRDNLIETVEHNVDEIEYYGSLEEISLNVDIDHYIQYRGGYLEIDDDFLDHINEVYTSLYEENQVLIYGENPISRESAALSFTDSHVQQLKKDGTLYYIFDRKLTGDGLDGLWLRGVVSELQGRGQVSEIVRISLVLLPFLVLFAVVGGYLIAGRMLSPVRELSQAASRIEKGGDLKQRIELGEGNDELHQLADSFNGMFARLDAAFEAERQFASDASHELRTPMSVINAQCEFILEKERSAPEYERALRVIQRQSGKMTRLISDMLDFTRLEMRTESYVREAVNLTELVTSVCEDMALLQENGITLAYEAQEDVVLTGNRELLTRLLMNLISNAYRYGKENGHICVRLYADAQDIPDRAVPATKKHAAENIRTGITLSVADDGIGISPEEQKKIFRRFYQADNSRSGQGTGLGLAMAAEIAQFHGGKIEVESELGRGSTFSVKFSQ